jgi:hypothetical protein
MKPIWNEELDANTILWRYFRTDRFLDLLATSSLYFAAATQFTDPFEGAIQVLSPEAMPLRRESERFYFQKAFAELRRLTKISCWHRTTHESDAMWRLYAASHKGVAVRTTVGRLNASLQQFRLAPNYGTEDPWYGNVRYVDLIKERAPSQMLNRFFCKHMPFAWEQEYRVAISLRMAEEFGVQVPSHGIQVSVALNELIGSVILGPDLDDLERQAILVAMEGAAIAERLTTSSLLGTPLYT